MNMKYRLLLYVFSLFLISQEGIALSGSVTLEKVDLKPWNRRVALVIGNSKYRLKPLINPGNDADSMTRALKSLGFQVLTLIDGDRKAILKMIRQFRTILSEERGVGLFYYAGHGVEVQGINYLIPIGAQIESEGDVEDEGIPIDSILKKMVSTNNWMNIVLLDACRNNPFQGSYRSTKQGFVGISAPQGTLVGYATAPGSISLDGEKGKNGLYTKYLLRSLVLPGVEFSQAMKLVTRGVQEETLNKQIPWKSDNLTADFYMNPVFESIAAVDKPQNQEPLYRGAVFKKKESWPWWYWAIGGALLAGVVEQIGEGNKNDNDGNCPDDQCGGVVINW